MPHVARKNPEGMLLREPSGYHQFPPNLRPTRVGDVKKRKRTRWCQGMCVSPQLGCQAPSCICAHFLLTARAAGAACNR